MTTSILVSSESKYRLATALLLTQATKPPTPYIFVHSSSVKPEVGLSEDIPFQATEKGGVEFDEAKMEIGRPYPFKIKDVWLIALKWSSEAGDVRLYQLGQ